jgi:hypothetical protein
VSIRVKTDKPDFEDIPGEKVEWCHNVYGYVEKLRPKDLPKPLGKSVTTITYKGANLYYNMVTGRSVSGILRFCNKDLIDWYLRMNLWYLGIPVYTKTNMFGDSQAVVTISTAIPHSSLNKRDNTLSYHQVYERIATKILGYYWIDGKVSPC